MKSFKAYPGETMPNYFQRLAAFLEKVNKSEGIKPFHVRNDN